MIVISMSEGVVKTEEVLTTEGESCLFSCDLATASFRCIILPYGIGDMGSPGSVSWSCIYTATG
jgi:hypothetical protein